MQETGDSTQERQRKFQDKRREIRKYRAASPDWSNMTKESRLRAISKMVFAILSSLF